jgi:ribonuclease I
LWVIVRPKVRGFTPPFGKKYWFFLFIFLQIYINTSACLAQNCPPPTSAGEQKGMPSGCFDILVFSLNWKLEYCTNIESYNCSNLFGRYTATQLGVHGLWPQYNTSEVTYPSYCSNSPGGDTFDKNKLSYETWNNYLMLTPINGIKLAEHEWKKHGTCSGLTQEDYFRKIINKAMKLPGTPVGFEQYINTSVSYVQLANLFGKEDEILLNCDYDDNSQRYYLISVSTFWDKNNTDIQIKNPGLVGTCSKDKLIYIRGVSQ